MKIVLLGECMVEFFQLVENVYHQNFAGDVYNTAVYLKRAAPNLDVQFFSAVGTDLVSDQLVAAVDAEKIGTSLLLRNKTARPGLYMINTDCFGERSFVYWRDSSAAKQVMQLFAAQQKQAELLTSQWFYFSGISLAILSAADREQLFVLLAKLKAAGIKLIFDPNYRPALWQNNGNDIAQCREAFIKAYQLADIALPGLDDHKVLFEANHAEDVLAQLKALGVPEILVKNGKEGVLLYADGQSQAISAVQVKKVVDTTAAGDSFNGGYLAARLQGANAVKSAEYAAALAGFVVQHTGAIVSRDNFALFSQDHPLDFAGATL
ncbi:MAG: sugar kinase [Gammaproteobacteria bacterium]|nr:sugar kinase [Gammaproteobacteria bacterium]